MSNARIVFLHAITPVHSGTGQAVAVIDLPIAREKATGFPIIPASSFKGVLRDPLEQQAAPLKRELKDLSESVDKLKAEGNISEADARTKAAEAKSAEIKNVLEPFGTIEAAGVLCFTDQRILCMPVRSYYGTFAYVTCPLVLSRLQRDMKALGIAKLPGLANIPLLADTMKLLLAPKSQLKSSGDTHAYLEDIDLTAVQEAQVSQLADELADILFPADKAAFISRFAIVSDAMFSFLCETATEVTARVALKEESKTVRKGGLWYEEAIPAEAILAGFVLIQNYGSVNVARAAKVLDDVNGKTIQLGGNASVGRGLCRFVNGG